MNNELYKYPNVVGHGLTLGEKKAVLVSRKLPLAALADHEVIPYFFEGQETDVINVGYVRALQLRTDRWRPAPPGVSIGHPKITAGTFGAVVKDNDGDEPLILSNAHVIANSGDAEIGNTIIQPGTADGGQVNADPIAALWRFEEIVFAEQPPVCDVAKGFAGLTNFFAKAIGSSHRLEAVQEDGVVNYIDAAVAKPYDPEKITDEILEIGKVTGNVEDVDLGMEIEKSGRTTEYTKGNVIVVDATISVSYGGGRTATFENQFICGPMSAGGDSGSLGITRVGGLILAAGLLFAGSEQVTIYNPIVRVLNTLGVRFEVATMRAAF